METRDRSPPLPVGASRAVTVLPGRGGGCPGDQCRAGYWEGLQGGSGSHGGTGDSGGHGGAGDSGGHGGSGDSGGHGPIFAGGQGGSGSSVALAQGPATQAKIFLGKFPSGSRSGGAGSGGRSGGVGSGGTGSGVLW